MVHLWRAAIATFVIAGATGSLLRFGFLVDAPLGLEIGNVRHAHSHLMYFGWATPALMGLMLAKLKRVASRHSDRLGRTAAMWALLLGWSTYPAFLVVGYGRVDLGGTELPIASILSGLNIIAWYVFVGWYVTATRGVLRTLTLRLWDGALFFLLLSSTGAWGRTLIEVLHVDVSGLADAAVHLFLGVFSEGWLLLAVLGLAFWDYPPDWVPEREADPMAQTSRWAYRLIWIGTPFAAFLGSGVGPLFPGWNGLISLGGILVVGGLSWYVGQIGRWIGQERRWEWAPIVGFFVLKIVMQLGMVFPGVADWGLQLGLRVVYMHVFTLGVVSAGLVVAASREWGRESWAPSPHYFNGSVSLLILGLLWLTPLWPGGGRAPLVIAAVTSLLPLVVVVWGLIGSHHCRKIRKGDRDVSCD